MRDSDNQPRIVIAGMSGDSGKTLIALALILALRHRGMEVRAYKKGPDYIDAAWLSWASGRPARNLDSYLMGFRGCTEAFAQTAARAGVNVIEGNRGLYDGSDAQGTHSTAMLARSLKAPVLLAVSTAKVTRTAAAWVLGCQKLDPQVHIVGAILNRVSGQRQEQVVRDAIESSCGIPVLGVIPRVSDSGLLPARHLGLVTTYEHPRIHELKDNLTRLVQGRLDLDGIVSLAEKSPPLEVAPASPPESPEARGLRMGFLRDAAFSFYYPENLEQLEQSGADLIPVSPLTANALPANLDALYIGGGFPETHGAALSANHDFLASLRSAALSGLPIYAECGGLMLLSQAIRWQDTHHPMAAVFPFQVEVLGSPQGHGYVELVVDQPNPFFPTGLALRGHEFHYSRIVGGTSRVPTACRVCRGTGCGQQRDGMVQGNVWAGYTHLHARGTPEWGRAMLNAAQRRARMRRG